MKAYLKLGLVLLVVSAAHAGDREQAKFSAGAERTAKRKQQVILTEIQRRAGHPWAGEYYAGDGLGVNRSLVIAPSAGFVFEWHGCLGLYDRNYGAAVWTNNRVRLSFTFENQRKGFQGIAPEFIPVAWGSRRYLIPTDEIVDFCYRVNEGWEPRDHRYGFYFLRRGDENKTATGVAEVPEQYWEYILTKPVEATIIAVSDGKPGDSVVTIDAGTERGLRVGMELFFTDVRAESFRITKVEEARSEAVLIEPGEQPVAMKAGARLKITAPPIHFVVASKLRRTLCPRRM